MGVGGEAPLPSSVAVEASVSWKERRVGARLAQAQVPAAPESLGFAEPQSPNLYKEHVALGR